MLSVLARDAMLQDDLGIDAAIGPLSAGVSIGVDIKNETCSQSEAANNQPPSLPPEDNSI